MKMILCCAVLVVSTVPLAADECSRCECCGSHANCCKVCRCVPTTKKVTKTTYECQCEDFCVPGPSERSIDCDECGHKKIVYSPTCATVRTRKKLIKKETVTEVPTTKWVVENLCSCCADKKKPGDVANVAQTQNGGPSLAERQAVDEDEADSPESTSLLSRVRPTVGRVFQPIFSQR
jgi:hypothetical protein